MFSFPLNCVSISKAQGESLKEVGINLREECFANVWLAQEFDLQKAYIHYWHPQA
jgi:hypothetical protein